MHSTLNLNLIISLIREFHGIPDSKIIESETRLENDLGITGDDGGELLEFLENKLGVNFCGKDGTIRDAFDLEEDEYLFNSEGFSLNIFTKNKVKELKVKDLLKAVIEIKN